MAGDATRESVHATALLYRDCGVLIRGPSGSGKSALALALLALARDSHAFAALVGDDRVHLRNVGGRLAASGSPRGEGMIERRMEGLVRVAHEAEAIVRLVVDLAERDRSWPRMPEEAAETAVISGVRLPRLAMDSTQGPFDHALAVRARLENWSADKIGGPANFA